MGDRAVIHRFQLHKMRSVDGYLCKAKRAYVLGQMRQAYKARTASSARRRPVYLPSWLERGGHEDAAASLFEGFEETITAVKLGLSHLLTRSLSTTNTVESVMNSIRRTTRNVKRWRDVSRMRRWVALSILEAQKKFRRLKGHSEKTFLVANLACSHSASKASGTAAA